MSLVASFASGIMRDRVAVHAAITEQRSNGQTEGQIHKAQAVEARMYPRKA
jgi:transposase